MNARPSSLIQCAGTLSTHQQRWQLHEMRLCKVSLWHFSPSQHVKSMRATRSLEKKNFHFILAQFLKNYTPPLRWYQMEWCSLHFLRLHASTAFLKLAQFFIQQSQSPLSFMIQIKPKHRKYITSFQVKEQSIVTPAAIKQWNWHRSRGGNMRPGWRKGWEGLPLLAEVYSYWLKALMKL